MPIQTAIFNESTNRSRSMNVKLPGVSSINSVTVDTGTVTYSLSGETLTLNVSNGTSVRTDTSSYTPSEYVTTTLYNDIDSFFDTTSVTSSSGYSGDIPKSGSSYVASGSASYTDSYTSQASFSCTATNRYEWTGSSWKKVDTWYNPESKSYTDEAGYSGTLYLVSWGGATVPTPSGSGGYIGETTTRSATGTGNYSGTVYKTYPDTRVYGQGYAGYVYGNTQYTYTYYYAYEVLIDYNTAVGRVTFRFPVGSVHIPFYETSTSPSNAYRLDTVNGVVCFNLVDVTDVKASPWRIKTPSGVKAIAKE